MIVVPAKPLIGSINADCLVCMVAVVALSLHVVDDI